MIYKPIDPRDIITVKDTVSSSKSFYITSSSLSSVPELTLSSNTILSSINAKVFNAYKETSSLSSEGKNYYNHILNFFYNQDPTFNFNPNLNYTDTVYPRLASLSSLTGFTVVTIDRGVVQNSIAVSSITAVINGATFKDGNKQLFNGLNRGTIYHGTSGVGDVFYDYGVLVFFGSYGTSSFSTNLSATFNTTVSQTMHDISSLKFSSLRESIKKRVFVRLFNYEFNYTSNPTALTPQGSFLNKIIEDPYTYISEITLHSFKNGVLEEVAIAKLSTPARKDFFTELNYQFDIEPIK